MTDRNQFKTTQPYLGLFVVVEGLDCSGKTTTIDSLKKKYEKQGYHVVVTREPGGTPIGETLRRELKDASNNFSDTVCLAMFYAARAALIDEVIVPALQNGSIVISDRYYLSSYAMQCWAGDVEEKTFTTLNEAFVGDVIPDSVIFLDVDEEIRSRRGMQRFSGAESRHEIDVFDARDTSYHQLVLQGFRRICKWHGDKVTTIRLTKKHTRLYVNGYKVHQEAEMQQLIDNFIHNALLPYVKTKKLYRESVKTRIANKFKDVYEIVRVLHKLKVW